MRCVLREPLPCHQCGDSLLPHHAAVAYIPDAGYELWCPQCVTEAMLDFYDMVTLADLRSGLAPSWWAWTGPVRCGDAERPADRWNWDDQRREHGARRGEQ